jgi:hypothetical protein
VRLLGLIFEIQLVPFTACNVHWLEVIFSHAGMCRAVLPANMMTGCGVGKSSSWRMGRVGGSDNVGDLHTDVIQEGAEAEVHVAIGWVLVASWDFPELIALVPCRRCSQPLEHRLLEIWRGNAPLLAATMGLEF